MMASRTADKRIFDACLAGRPDWFEVSGLTGLPPDECLGRAEELGALWLVGIGPERLERARFAVDRGADAYRVAEALGADVHAALVLAGMRAIWRP